MGHTRIRPRRLSLVTVGSLLLLLVLTGCGSNNDSAVGPAEGTDGSAGGDLAVGPGVTEEEIRVGVLAPLTGPIAVLGEPLAVGVRAFVAHANETMAERLGERDLVLVEEDTEYNPQRAVESYARISDDVAGIVMSVGSPPTNAVMQRAATDNVVVGQAGWDSTALGDTNRVLTGTPYAIDVANATEWIVESQGGASETFAIAYQDDDYGHDGLRGLTSVAEAYGVEVVAEVAVKPGETDYAASVQRLVESEADNVILTVLPGAVAGLVAGSEAAGFSPRWVANYPAWNVGFLDAPDLRKLFVDTADYNIVGSLAAWNSPESRDVIEAINEYQPGTTPDPYVLLGWTVAQAFHEVLVAAYENGDLSRDGIADARQSLGEVDFSGLQPTATYGDTATPPSRSSRIFDISADEVTGWVEIEPLFTGELAESMEFS